MSATSARASEQGMFAAREFIARYVRETGQSPPPAFAYEMGYLRGRSDATADAVKMFENAAHAHKEPGKDSNDDDTDETK